MTATRGNPPLPYTAPKGSPEWFIHEHSELIQEFADMWELGRAVIHSGTLGEILQGKGNHFCLPGHGSEAELGEKENPFACTSPFFWVSQKDVYCTL